MLILKAEILRRKGEFMIKQPEYGIRNVNDSFYIAEGKMIKKMNEVLNRIELSKDEEKTFIWLTGCEEYTVNNILSVIQKAIQMGMSKK